MIRKAVGAIIKDNDDNYLMVHKVKIKDGTSDKSMDSWDFVKGGMKEGESPQQAMERELFEETSHNRYIIEQEFKDKLYFDFSPELTALLGFHSQETTMFLVRYYGALEECKANDDEIAEVKFFDKAQVEKMLSMRETKEFWSNYLRYELEASTMSFQEAIELYRGIYLRFEKAEYKPWGINGAMIELSKQVGDLSKWIMIKEQYYAMDGKMPDDTVEHIGDELADIFGQLIRIADYYHIDLEEAHIRARNGEDDCLKQMGV